MKFSNVFSGTSLALLSLLSESALAAPASSLAPRYAVKGKADIILAVQNAQNQIAQYIDGKNFTLLEQFFTPRATYNIAVLNFHAVGPKNISAAIAASVQGLQTQHKFSTGVYNVIGKSDEVNSVVYLEESIHPINGTTTRAEGKFVDHWVATGEGEQQKWQLDDRSFFLQIDPDPTPAVVVQQNAVSAGNSGKAST